MEILHPDTPNGFHAELVILQWQGVADLGHAQLVNQSAHILTQVASVTTICKYMPARFTWDPAKNRTNVRRHGIAFPDAARIFDGPTVEREDDRYDYGELRVYAIGLVNGVEVTVIYVD